MKRPGTWLRTLAARWCQPGTMERLIDPMLADWQVEYESALRAGRKWASRWIWIAGHFTFVKLMLVHGAGRLGDIRDLPHDDRLVLRHILRIGLGTMVVTTILLCAPIALRLSQQNAAPTLAVYSVPNALPLTIPIGVMFAVLLGLGRRAVSRRSRALILAAAIASSVASLAMVGWIGPAANHAYRVSVAKRTIPKWDRELTLGELRRQLERAVPDAIAANEIRRLSFQYYERWSLACAPAMLAMFALVLTRRRARGGPILGLMGCAVVFGHYVAMFTGRSLSIGGTLPIAVGAWVPNIALLVLTALTAALTKRSAPPLEPPARV